MPKGRDQMVQRARNMKDLRQSMHLTPKGTWRGREDLGLVGIDSGGLSIIRDKGDGG